MVSGASGRDSKTHTATTPAVRQCQPGQAGRELSSPGRSDKTKCGTASLHPQLDNPTDTDQACHQFAQMCTKPYKWCGEGQQQKRVDTWKRHAADSVQHTACCSLLAGENDSACGQCKSGLTHHHVGHEELCTAAFADQVLEAQEWQEEVDR